MTPGAVASIAPAIPPEARAAIAELAAATPDWAPWLGMLEAALDHADTPQWRASEIRFARARPIQAPLLEGARILVDPAAARGTLVALLELAGVRPPEELDALGLLEAGIAQDEARVARMGEAAGLAPAPLATVVHFLSLPVLLEAGRRATPAVPSDWGHGYCPVCGAWPALAELRGLERRRVLCCGRCGTGWARAVLHCAYCGERDHRQQGALVPDGEQERLRIETCHSCRGYLKVATTLRAKPVWELHLTDLGTLPLELTARDRSFIRPDAPGWRARAAVAARTGEA